MRTGENIPDPDRPGHPLLDDSGRRPPPAGSDAVGIYRPKPADQCPGGNM
jgi:hypothetical protein